MSLSKADIIFTDHQLIDLLFPIAGPIFGNRDYFTGLGIFFDTYNNYNGEHSVHIHNDIIVM